MDEQVRVSTGIDGLDEAIDFLRPGDTVVWQIDHIGDYMFAATKLVTKLARSGRRFVYIRFGARRLRDLCGAGVPHNKRRGEKRLFRFRLPLRASEILVFRPYDLKLLSAYKSLFA